MHPLAAILHNISWITDESDWSRQDLAVDTTQRTLPWGRGWLVRQVFGCGPYNQTRGRVDYVTSVSRRDRIGQAWQ